MILLLCALALAQEASVSTGPLAVDATRIAVLVGDEVQVWDHAGALQGVWPTGPAELLSWDDGELLVVSSSVDRWRDGQLLDRVLDEGFRADRYRAFGGDLVGLSESLLILSDDTTRPVRAPTRGEIKDVAENGAILFRDQMISWPGGELVAVPSGLSDCLLLPDGGSVICRASARAPKPGCAAVRLSLPELTRQEELPGCQVLATGAGAVLLQDGASLVYATPDGRTLGRTPRGTTAPLAATGPGGLALRLGPNLVWLGDDGRTWIRPLGDQPVTPHVLPRAPTLILHDGVVVSGVDPATGIARWALAARSVVSASEGRAGQAGQVRLDATGWRPVEAATTPPLRAQQASPGLVAAARGDAVAWTASSRRLVGLTEDVVLVVTTQGAPRLECLKLASGRVLWRRPLPAGATARWAGGLLLVEVPAGPVELWSLAGGEPLLRLPAGSRLEPQSVPDVARVAGTTEDTLVDLRTQVRYTVDPDASLLARTADGALVVASNAKRTAWVELMRDGAVVWRLPLGLMPSYIYAVALDDLLLVRVGDQVLALDAATAALRWSRPVHGSGGLTAWRADP